LPIIPDLQYCLAISSAPQETMQEVYLVKVAWF
jgi:hypothetical protein